MELSFKKEWYKLNSIDKKYTSKDFFLISKKILKDNQNLKVHVERLFIATKLNNKEFLWAAILDLFFILQDRETTTKTEAIVLSTKLINKTERDILIKFFHKPLSMNNKFTNTYSKICLPSLAGRSVKTIRDNQNIKNILESNPLKNERELLNYYKHTLDKSSFYKMKTKLFKSYNEVPKEWDDAIEFFQEQS